MGKMVGRASVLASPSKKNLRKAGNQRLRSANGALKRVVAGRVGFAGVLLALEDVNALVGRAPEDRRTPGRCREKERVGRCGVTGVLTNAATIGVAATVAG